MRSIIKVCGKEIRIEGRLIRMAQLEGDGYEYLEDPKAMLEGLRECKTRIDSFSFMQRLPVTTFDHWWTQQIGFKARNKAKQGEKKGVVVREAPFDDALVKGIWEVYNENPLRQGTANTHFGKSIEAVHRMEETFLDNSIFIGAYLGNNLIGFAKLVHDETRTQAGLMNIVSMIRHRDMAPTNMLVAQAVRSCAQRGIAYLVYSRYAYGKKQQSSLTDFKERNGFKQIDLPRYYVPLTQMGTLALRLGLHHRLSERIPESVAAKPSP